MHYSYLKSRILELERKSQRLFRFFKIQDARSTIQDCAGFTLVEALVAVSILTTAVAAPLVIISSNIAQTAYARDEATAVFLTQEAFEVVRHLRDNDSLLNTPGAAWNPAGLTACIGNAGDPTPVCVVDAPSRALFVCPGGTCTFASHAMTYNGSAASGLYQNTVPPASGEGIVPTKFLRTVYIRRAPAPADNRELWVTASTSWTSGAAKDAAGNLIQQSYSIQGILMRD